MDCHHWLSVSISYFMMGSDKEKNKKTCLKHHDNDQDYPHFSYFMMGSDKEKNKKKRLKNLDNDQDCHHWLSVSISYFGQV